MEWLHQSNDGKLDSIRIIGFRYVFMSQCGLDEGSG